MVRLLLEQHLDMVSGARVEQAADAYRRGHRLGNAVLTGMVRWVFGNRISDLLSGYRVFSRRFVKSFPALAAGFETETEFSVHALELRMPIGEVPTSYRERPAGSASKLRTYVDGWRILRTIVVLVKEERPLQFFWLSGAVLMLIGFGLGIPVVLEFMETGLVLRLPTAVLTTVSCCCRSCRSRAAWCSIRLPEAARRSSASRISASPRWMPRNSGRRQQLAGRLLSPSQRHPEPILNLSALPLFPEPGARQGCSINSFIWSPARRSPARTPSPSTMNSAS